MSKQTAEPTGSLATALGHAGRLLTGQPAKAAEQAREILKVVPLQPQAMLILGVAQRQMGDLNAARETLQTLSAHQPKAATVFLELGRVLAAMGESNAAITTLKNATKLNPASAEVWQALAEQYELAGSDELANAAMAQQIRHSTRDPALIEAASALCENKLSVAERLLRDFLKSHPVNVAAIRMLAETGARLGRLEDAENFLARCLELAPGFTAARHNYALLLQRQTKSREALQQVDILLREDQKNPNYRALKAAVSCTNWRLCPGHRVLRNSSERTSAPAQILDELRPCAEDGRPSGRQHHGLSKEVLRFSRPGRSMVEPCQPENLPFHARRH